MEAEKTLTEASVSENLVDRIVDGDKSAEVEMVERYQRGLGVMLFNRSRDRELASDVAQQTWLLVLQKVRNNELRDKTKLASFIIQIAKNQLIMRQRASSRYDSVDEENVREQKDSGPSPESALVNAQLGQTVKRLLDDMAVERDRDILRRFYLIGDEKEQLCKEFDLTPAHFDRVLYRARERFKGMWQQSIGENVQ